MADQPAHSAYLEDIVYPVTYFRELSPAWLNYAAVINGAAPQPLNGSFRYLELGCGQGLSSIVHAAAFPQAEFHACDFNAACIRSGRRVAAALSVGNLAFHESSFADLLSRDLPPFDFVVVHGVYSWVDEATRETIRRLIDARLAPGGLAYVSYNCMPGWTSEVPLRRLMTELASSCVGDASERAQAAAQVLHGLSGAGLGYFRLNPEASMAVASYLRRPASYLAHEFLNGTWAPLYSVDVADAMAAVNLQLLGSATLVDNYQPLLVDMQAAGLIAALPTARQRRLAMDFAVHRRFRRDLFIRSGRHTEPVVRAEQLAPLMVGCLEDPAAIAEHIDVPRGRITFDSRFIHELGGVMADGSAAIPQLVDALARVPGDGPGIVRNLLYLIAAGQLTPFARGRRSTVDCRRPRFTSPTIRKMVNRVATSGGSGWIASQASGGGIKMDHTEARAVVDYVHRERPLRCPPTSQVERLLRLGILV